MSDGAVKGKEHDVPVRYLITIALFAHGVGHLLFVANSWGYWKGGEEGHSWLFSGMLGAGQAVEGIFGLLWFIPLVGFVAVSWGYLAHQGWWLQLALTSAAISLAMIVLWWGSLVTGSAFFALVFDLAVIVVVLWQLRSGAGVSAQ
jgi:hypothetical protein